MALKMGTVRMSIACLLPLDDTLDRSDSSLSADWAPAAPVRSCPLEVTSSLVGTEKRERDLKDRLAEIQRYRKLPDNWDKYGGKAAVDHVVNFAVNLLSVIRVTPEVSAPLVRPISGGVYLEWRSGNSILYFEADEESVLRYSRNTFGEETTEDFSFDVEKAYRAVVEFHESAA